MCVCFVCVCVCVCVCVLLLGGGAFGGLSLWFGVCVGRWLCFVQMGLDGRVDRVPDLLVHLRLGLMD